MTDDSSHPTEFTSLLPFFCTTNLQKRIPGGEVQQVHHEAEGLVLRPALSLPASHTISLGTQVFCSRDVWDAAFSSPVLLPMPTSQQLHPAKFPRSSKGHGSENISTKLLPSTFSQEVWEVSVCDTGAPHDSSDANWPNSDSSVAQPRSSH